MPRRIPLVLLTVGAVACASAGTVAHSGDSSLFQNQVGSSRAPAAEAQAIRISLTPSGAGRWTVRADVMGASRVELAGDFSDWDPIPLARMQADDWAVDVRVPSGVHQLAMRVDGGPWRVPAGLASVTDEFGGVAGVLVVPAGSDAGARRGSPPGEGVQ